MAKYHQTDDVGWDRGREGYLDLPQKPVYAPVPKPGKKAQGGPLLAISTEVRLGSVITVGGLVWGAYVATIHYAGIINFDMVGAGPMEVCALGILIWLHAKWRRATKVD